MAVGVKVCTSRGAEGEFRFDFAPVAIGGGPKSSESLTSTGICIEWAPTARGVSLMTRRRPFTNVS